MKTVTTYLFAIFFTLYLDMRAQSPGDYRALPTNNSHGKREMKREEKNARREKHRRDRLQRKSTQGFIMGGRKERKEQRMNRKQKRHGKKRERKAGMNAESSIATKSLYHRLRKVHHHKHVEK